MKNITAQQIVALRRAVYGHYRLHGRHYLPWRRTDDPYHIMVSEIMLQQTQVPRVAVKYGEFLSRFPTVRSLARAPLRAVLREWSGLGYNRRALYLKRAAQRIGAEHGGRVPDTIAGLEKLPGIGPNTAGAIMAYAYNRPIAYLETNVRAVLLHHFFRGRAAVGDRELLAMAERVLDRDHPRCWHSALMDYGTWLKSQVTDPSRASAHAKTQSRFEGSNRQLRGMIVRSLTRRARSLPQLAREMKRPQAVIRSNLRSLRHEGLVAVRSGVYRIS